MNGFPLLSITPIARHFKVIFAASCLLVTAILIGFEIARYPISGSAPDPQKSASTISEDEISEQNFRLLRPSYPPQVLNPRTKKWERMPTDLPPRTTDGPDLEPKPSMPGVGVLQPKR